MLLAQGGSCIYWAVYSVHRLLNFGPRSEVLTPWSSLTLGDCHLKHIPNAPLTWEEILYLNQLHYRDLHGYSQEPGLLR